MAESILISPFRTIGRFTADATIEETHVDELQITDHPIESGAPVTDHAFKKPETVTIKAAWQDNPDGDDLATIYRNLLVLQEDRVPFSIFTGKRIYRDMLVQTLTCVTNQQTENMLSLAFVCRRVFMVTSGTITFPAQEVQALPEQTAATQPKGVKTLKVAP